MKKKSLILFLFAALILAVGCGKNKYSSDSISSTAVSKEDTSDNGKETAKDTGEKTQGTDTLTAASLYSVIPTHHSSEIMSKDKSVVLLYSDYDTIEIQGDEYGTLAEKVAEWQDAQLEDWEQAEDEYVQMASDDRKTIEDFSGYALSYDISLKRLDHRVLSMTNSCYSYLGGVHPSYYVGGINFDAATGELLSLEDIVTDYNNFSEAAVNYIINYLEDSEYADGLFPEYKEMVSDSFNDIPWYFSADGIVIIYNTYEIAPYAAGTIEVPLPLQDFSDYFKDVYRISETPGLAAIPFGEMTTVYLVEKAHTILLNDLYSISTSNKYTENSVTVTLDNSSFPMDKYFHYVRDCYIIRQDDRTLLMLDGDLASDDYVTVLLDISDGKIREVTSTYASICTPGIQTTLLSIRVDALGTYTCEVEYDLSSGNELEPPETEYIIEQVHQNLVTTRKLPVTDEVGKERTLSAGTSLIPLATDGKSYMRFKNAKNNKEYTVYFSREEYTIVIDGIEEYEYFEDLPYAG